MSTFFLIYWVFFNGEVALRRNGDGDMVLRRSGDGETATAMCSISNCNIVEIYVILILTKFHRKTNIPIAGFN